MKGLACTTLLAALLTAPLAGCGLGTEIGNGNKPSTGTSTSTGNTTGASTTANGAPAASTTTQNAPTGASTANTATQSAGDAATPGDDPLTLALPFHLDVLTAPCGSVFAEALAGPITLYHTPQGGAAVPVLKATQNQAGAWVLADANGTTVRNVTTNPAQAGGTGFAVLVTDPKGAALPETGVTCSIGVASGSITQIMQEMHITTSSYTADVVWTLKPSVAVAGKQDVVGISIKESDEAGGDVELTTSP